MAAYAGFMAHVTCRMTAKNRDQLPNHTLGNQLWAVSSVLDLLTAGPNKRPTFRAAAAIWISAAGPRLTSAANPPATLLLSGRRADGRTDGRTLDRFITITAYYADGVKVRQF